VDDIDVRWRLSEVEPRRPKVFYLAPGARLMATSIAVKGAAIEAGTPVTLFQPRMAGGGAFLVGSRQQYDVAPDGRFLVNVETAATSPPITLVSNWTPKP
jgi:hypothetical protein